MNYFSSLGRSVAAALLLLAAAPAALAQTGGVGIGTTAPNASAALDIVSSTKGALLPRLTAAQRAAIANPATGLLVFQTDAPSGFYYNAGTPAAPDWQVLNTSTGDNLGNHTATQNLNLGSNLLVGNGGSTGLSIANSGAAKLASLAGTGTRMVTADNTGTLAAAALPTDAQQLSVASGNLTISGGNSVTLASLGDNLGTHNATTRLNLGTQALVGNGGTAGLTITSGGGVGIGTTATQLLDVNGGILARGSAAISTQGAYLQWNRSSGDGETWLLNQQGSGGANTGIRFGGVTTANATTEWGRFLNNGNFGIGLTNPGQKLEVAGGIKFNGLSNALTFPDGSTQTTAAVTATGVGFIQNQTTQQAASNFNISGNGTIGGNATVTGSSTIGSTQTVAGTSTIGGLLTASAGATVTGSTTVDAAAANTGTAANFLRLGASNSGEGLGSKRNATGNQFGLDFYTLSLNRLAITSGGNVGIGTTTPGQKLEVNGNALINSAYDLLIRDTNAGLGWYGTGKLWNGVSGYDGPVLYGYSGGLLGTNQNGTRTTALAWNSSGQVGMGTTAPNASAALDVTSTTGGLLPPRLTQAQRDAINPAASAAGLTIYNTFTNKLNVWNGTAWTEALTTTEAPFQNPAQSFGYTGGAQTYVVPPNVYSLTIDARGAQGGAAPNGSNSGPGGLGGRLQGTVPVTPGETLTIRVGGPGTTEGAGGAGGAGYNGGGNGFRYGGGGGGASDVRRGAAQLADRLLTAGGGGGGAGSPAPNSGGGGGYPNGVDANSYYVGRGGGGGTQTGPGSGGSPGAALGQGGQAIQPLSGGGGGGYYGGGGGGGGAGTVAPGGGGSSWVTPTGATLLLTETGTVNGAGSVTVTPGLAYAAPALSGANFVDVPGTWSVSGGDLYRAGGSVGIGTSSPGHPLTVQANGGGALLGFNTSAGADKYNFSLTNGGLNLSESYVAGGRLFVQDGTGRVGIGTTNPGQALTVIGTICASGGLNCTSDGRYKREVVPVQGALASVLKLRGVTYYWKQAEFPDKQFSARRQLGFIAQEIEPYYPEMVTTDTDGYKSVDYSRLTPVLVEALKEQQQQIEALKREATEAKAAAAAAEAKADAATTKAATAETQAAQATVTLETFEARLRRLEAAGEGQARK